MKRMKRNLRNRLITQEKPNAYASEQYKTIRTNIEYSSIDKKIRTLVITSANPAEGKSTTAANIAVSFAQAGKKVLLIDGDLRKPTVHTSFRIENKIGLINILVKKESLLTVVSDTMVENLSVLTSGPTPPNPAEMLNSKAMVEMLEEARVHFEIVILDTPPVLSVTDAQVLGNQCDATLLVVRSNVTERRDALEAKSRLQQSRANLIGTILHGVETHIDNYYLEK